MYLFKGLNPQSGTRQEKIFENEDEAIEYADDNSFEYAKFKVVDIDTGDIVYDHKEAKDNIDTATENMFPDEDSEDGFDWTLGD